MTPAHVKTAQQRQRELTLLRLNELCTSLDQLIIRSDTKTIPYMELLNQGVTYYLAGQGKKPMPQGSMQMADPIRARNARAVKDILHNVANDLQALELIHEGIISTHEVKSMVETATRMCYALKDVPDSFSTVQTRMNSPREYVATMAIGD